MSILDEAVLKWDYKKDNAPKQWSSLVVLWLRSAGINADMEENDRVFCPLAMDFFKPARPTMKCWCEELERLGDLQVMYERPRP